MADREACFRLKIDGGHRRQRVVGINSHFPLLSCWAGVRAPASRNVTLSTATKSGRVLFECRRVFETVCRSVCLSGPPPPSSPAGIQLALDDLIAARI